jgi:hypothetical protein
VVVVGWVRGMGCCISDMCIEDETEEVTGI